MKRKATKYTPEQKQAARERKATNEAKIAKFRAAHEAVGLPISDSVITQMCIVQPFDLRTKGVPETVQEDEL